MRKDSFARRKGVIEARVKLAPSKPSGRPSPVDGAAGCGRLHLVKGFSDARKYLCLAGLLVLIFSLLPLGTAFELGGDEGFELNKGFLHSNGFALYSQIWSDQPPLYTLLLSLAFRTLSPSILIARLTAAGFGLVLFLTFFSLVRRRSGLVSAWCAVFLLVSSPCVLLLSVSVMKEIPSVAIALFSASLVLTGRTSRTRLIASGLAMAAGMQVKFAPGLFIPAILIELFLRQDSAETAWRRRLWAAAEWLLVTAAAFLLIGAVWGRGSASPAWQAHFVPHPHPATEDRARDFPLPATVFLDHIECVLLAGILLVWVFRNARRNRTRSGQEYAQRPRLLEWSQVRFPIVLLVTVLGFHAFHRPFWMYYYLHFAVPLAWLGGAAAAGLIARVRSAFNPAKPPIPITPQAVFLILLALGFPLVRSSARLRAEILDMRHHETVASSAVLATMKQHAPATHWAYAEPGTYAFHAGLPVPPELAVTSRKRFWSGQITTNQIVEICRRYGVEQIVLSPGASTGPWTDFLRSDYRVASQDRHAILYLSVRLREEVRGE
jgi:hypothetical protein